MTSTPPRTVVDTTAGPVSGRPENGVVVFRGIPYAAPPFGGLRFRPPRPPLRWTEPRPCVDFGPTAPKPVYRDVVADLLPEPVIAGAECLNLNVWTPDPAASGLPVLVWIHGGSFQNGSNAVPVYDGTAFARDGVVVVSVNYRLGVDGFARLAGAPDNRGLLDQVAALRWVGDNIAAFGGDPARVTVCGESAGAMGVTTLTAMPAARGLFQRVIAQSGAGHHAIGTETADKIAADLADRLGVEPSARAIAEVPLEALLNAHRDLADAVGRDPDPVRWGEVAANMMAFEPVVDGDSLPGLPYDVIAAGEGASVDVLIGTNDDEHALFLYPVVDALEEHRVRLMLDQLGAGPDAYERYAATSERPGDVLVAGLTDWFFRVPAVRLAEARLARGADTHVYEFGWRSPVLGGVLRACHALEIGFVFDCLAAEGGRAMVGGDPPQALADDMHGAWVRFATDGDPGWPAYGEDRHVRRFGGADDGQVVTDPEPYRRALWPNR